MRWVAERNAKIVALRKQGLWPTQIADQMGLNRNQVLWALFRAGMCRKDTDKREAMRLKAKLDACSVAEIRARYVEGCPDNGYSGLARRFKVSDSAIRKVVSGKTWSP